MKKEERTVRRPRDAWRASIVTHEGGGDVCLQIPFAAPLGFSTDEEIEWSKVFFFYFGLPDEAKSFFFLFFFFLF